MSYGLALIEHSFNNFHFTYIKNNCIILRENGIADCIYKVKLDLQFDSANTYFDINNEDDQYDDDEISNYDIQPLLNISPLGEDKYLIELLCRCLCEVIRKNDPSLTSIIIHLPSRLFTSLKDNSKQDRLMEILYNFKNMSI
ncbi:uncharacterized protein HGUI_03980 [Hanseniaspora guilliermondii]|uniref:Uncharacterized protein n=1 Tax=Hanseniaspora guilliermondii TaxID=56406 RepID=A0A1L0B9F2_9ASCO|nr:uncharacterized protein HGUI_03980 [Hanseniaspora guilliermondii]